MSALAYVFGIGWRVLPVAVAETATLDQFASAAGNANRAGYIMDAVCLGGVALVALVMACLGHVAYVYTKE